MQREFHLSNFQGVLGKTNELLIPHSFYQKNRQRLVENFKRLAPDANKDSVLLFKGVPPVPRHDEDFEYIPNQEATFQFLFGAKEAGCHGLIELSSMKTTLIVSWDLSGNEHWTKKPTKEELLKAYGTDQVLLESEVLKYFQECLFPEVYLNCGVDYFSDKETDIPTWEWLSSFKTIKEPLYDAVNSTRMIKSEEEIEVMRHVNLLSSEAHESVMRNCKPGLAEYQLEALFTFHHLQKAGARFVAYECICASDCDAAILHYIVNDKVLKDGCLVLCDMGGRYQGYCADITCTFPINGKFTEKQKQIYDIVLEAQAAAYQVIKPNVKFGLAHKVAEKSILKGLLDLGLLQGGSVEKLQSLEIGEYFFPHLLGHFIGLRVHDVGEPSRTSEKEGNKSTFKSVGSCTLKKNMCVTNEPGIYFIDLLIEKAKANEELKQYFNFGKVARIF